MAQINEIANVIVIVCTALGAMLGIIEKSTKIKWKPLTKLFGNTELHKKIDEIATNQNLFMKRLNDIEDENDKREIKRLRARILDFANEKCEQGIKMTQEQETYFDDCCVDYENLIKKHSLKNGHTMQSMKLVSDYRKMELQDKYKDHIKK